MKVTIYIEGGASGPNSRLLQTACRENFHKLFRKCGFTRPPELRACGSRDSAYSDFKHGLLHATKDRYVILLIDSEDPVTNVELTWDHLKKRDKWVRPNNADDQQVLLMTTCMESWIVADLGALRAHYKSKLQETALPPTYDLETRNRHDIQNSLERATRNCDSPYRKGMRSYEILGKLNPTELKRYLPSFSRCESILRKKLT